MSTTAAFIAARTHIYTQTRARIYTGMCMHIWGYVRTYTASAPVQRHPEYRMWRHSRTWPDALWDISLLFHPRPFFRVLSRSERSRAARRERVLSLPATLLTALRRRPAIYSRSSGDGRRAALALATVRLRRISLGPLRQRVSARYGARHSPTRFLARVYYYYSSRTTYYVTSRRRRFRTRACASSVSFL